MKVAIVHDWLTGMRGGERCLEAFLCLYPQSEIFTLIHIPGTTSREIDRRVKQTSFLSKLPGVRRYYRALLPFYPVAVRSLDLRGYDLVISLSHAAAKNVRVEPGVTHVCYCFTPMRYIWDQVAYYFTPLQRFLGFPILERLRRWDQRGSKGVTHFVAISPFIAARIRKFYGRRAAVIAPPVRLSHEVNRTLTSSEVRTIQSLPASFFMCGGALVPYKRIDVAIDAFCQMNEPLLIVGDGPELRRLKRQATPNITFLGSVSDALLWACYRRCKALIFPGIEDFGIVPLECLASGRPVIGIDGGGLRKSVLGYRPWTRSRLVDSQYTGVFIPRRAYGDPQALMAAVGVFIQHEDQFNSDAALAQAARFSYTRFFEAWTSFATQVGIDTGSASNRSDELGIGDGYKGRSC